LRSAINLREDLRVSRAVIITLAEAGHTEIRERPKQEKGSEAFPPKRAAQSKLHIDDYSTLP